MNVYQFIYTIDKEKFIKNIKAVDKTKAEEILNKKFIKKSKAKILSSLCLSDVFSGIFGEEFIKQIKLD